MELTGHVDEISRSRVEGWVFDSEHPGEPVSVSIFVNGIHRGSCLASRPRPDLRQSVDERIPVACGFHFAFDPPLSAFSEHRVEAVETWSSRPLSNGSSVLPRPLRSGGGSGRIPILVTSTGRSGSTMLMSELARHKDIVIGDRYPYEIKQIAYHAAAFRALVADADRTRSTHPDTMLAPTMRHIIGGNPYNMAGFYDLGTSGGQLRDYYQSVVPSGYASLYRTLILEFYASLAAGQHKPSAPFFAEKGDIDEAALQGARLFFDEVKEIIILRDPRDMLCSAIAFWKLPPDEALGMLCTTFPRLVQVAHHAGPDTIVVRYEDLIRDPVAIRRAMSDFLGIDLLEVTATDGDNSPGAHRTSQNADASIGRWRRDLTPEQIDACERAFGPGMREFDYETADAEADSARSFTNRRLAGENQILAAEGATAVSTYLEAALLEDGEAPRQLLQLNFGERGNGTDFMLDGWSLPERGYVWSCAEESQVRLPPIRQPGEYELWIVATPFTDGNVLPAQRVTILLNGQEAGVARVRAISVLALAVPSQVAASGKTITVTFQFPDAARPFDVNGKPDGRLLGFSLHRMSLFRTEASREAEERVLGQPVRYVGAPVETPPMLTPEWRAGAAD
jgi:hypothetical protein